MRTAERPRVGRGRRFITVLPLVACAALASPLPGSSDPLSASSQRLAPQRLADLLAGDAGSAPGEILATGAEVLALQAFERKHLERWVRTGGRLFLVGEALDLAIRLFPPGPELPPGSARTLGLGDIVTLGDEAAFIPTAREKSGCELLEPAELLARSALPANEASRLATALRLGTYVLLLCAGFLVTLSFSRVWRVAGAASLVLLFGLWPWWGPRTPWGTGRWNQVDVSVDVGGGPSIVWSAAALRAAGRGPTDLLVGTGSWDLRLVEARGLVGPAVISPGDERIEEGPRVSFETTRSSQIGLGWLSQDEEGERVVVEVSGQDRRPAGLVRNGFPRTWTDVWLLLPGAEPQHLEDLAPLGAVIVEKAGPFPVGGSGGREEIWARLPLGRARLLEAAFGCAIGPLLERGHPVLVAWSDGPARPARTLPGNGIAEGTTLLISTGRMLS